MHCVGTTALVTGAAKRVGRAIALELAAAGCDVAVHYHTSRDEAEAVAEEIRDRGRRALTVAGDLSNPNAPAAMVKDVLDEWSHLNVLVNNASVFEPDPAGLEDLAHWQRMFQVNAIAPARLMAEAAPALAANGTGKVINLSDISAQHPWAGYQAYCASKAAMDNLTRSWARKLAPAVQVNGIAPGIAAFPDHYDEARRRKLIEAVPLGCAGTPEGIAHAARFFVEHGDYITGQIINVDGGRSLEWGP